jgi:hypothetical protein
MLITAAQASFGLNATSTHPWMSWVIDDSATTPQQAYTVNWQARGTVMAEGNISRAWR